MTPPLSSARRAILETLPDETSLHGRAPDSRFLHVPASHAKALHPDAQIVIGMRGAGKSFWWAALQEASLRRLVAGRIRRLDLFERAEVRAGFGERPEPERYPGRDTLEALLGAHDARRIWRAVLLHALRALDERAAEVAVGPADSGWDARVAHATAHPEAVERFLAALDARLEREDRYALVLFDALDRSASSWEAMHRLVRGLLQVALDLRAYRRLRLKCFLRTDQLDETRAADFPDASKVLASRVELSWPAHELYALLFQHLGNAQDGAFRGQTQEAFGRRWRRVEEVWLPDDDLARDEPIQRQVFHAIAGRWMGRDHRRGFPYTWVVGHLADTHRRTSPRSFLSALREAAQDSERRYPEHDWPLHYESIKRGVQRASSIRRDELQEDYPWVHALMEPLAGRVVPCDFEGIEAAWAGSGVLARLTGEAGGAGGRLPPPSLGEGAAGLRRDLEELGIFEWMRDGRVNIPDVFRVAYGLGRRGGVRPIQRGQA